MTVIIVDFISVFSLNSNRGRYLLRIYNRLMFGFLQSYLLGHLLINFVNLKSASLRYNIPYVANQKKQILYRRCVLE